MTDVDWEALRDQYQAGYAGGVAELRAAASRLRQFDELDDGVRTALAELFTGLADDAETTGPDPRALSVARSLAALGPRPALRQLEPPKPRPAPEAPNSVGPSSAAPTSAGPAPESRPVRAPEWRSPPPRSGTASAEAADRPSRDERSMKPADHIKAGTLSGWDSG